MKTETLNVKGMTCGGCVNDVTKSLKARHGVSDVAVDLAQGKVTVEFDPSRNSAGDLRTAIESAGFEVVESRAPPESGGCCCGNGRAEAIKGECHDKP